MKDQEKLVLAASIISGLTACVSSTQFPTYRYAGIDLGASIRGELIKSEGCFAIQTNRERYLPVFPSGTAATSDGVSLPQANGGNSLMFGKTYEFVGGMNPSASGFEFNSTSKSCDGTPFIINKIGDDE